MASVQHRESLLRSRYFVFLLILLCNAGSLSAEDWPQWRGPHRDSISSETGLLKSWPVGGPKVAWKATELGSGYSSIVIGSGQLFTMGRKDSAVVVTALEATNGQRVWTRQIGETSRHPCSTPTLDGDHLYCLDPDGELVCLQSATGEIVWQRSFVDEFAGRMMSGRGYGESPLIDGDRLICTPGGEDAAMIALDKLTGKLLWKSKLPDLGPHGRDGAGFSSIVLTEAAGLRQYVQLMGRGVVGFDASDGRFLWGYNAIANGTANIPTPIVYDEYVFSANGYAAGSVLLKLVADEVQNGEPPGVKAEIVYTLSGSQFQNHHGGVVRIGDYLYAGHGNNNGLPTCLDFKTGQIVWKRRGPGVGSAAVVFVDGQLYFRYQDGVVALIEASNRGYQLHGTLVIPGAGGDSWSHPVVSNGRLYLREQETLWVYDLRRESSAELPDATRPVPVSNAAISDLRKLGVAVEPLTALESGKRFFQFASSDTLHEPGQAPNDRLQLVTISNSSLAPGGTVTDELIGRLRDLRAPMVLNLPGTQISDAGLKQFESLEVFGLNVELCSRMTDAGLENIRRIQPLRELVLSGTGVTHVGLRHLASHTGLLALDLELCDGVTDEACEPLGNMKQLRSLVLKKSGFEQFRISDVGLQRLQNLSELEVLNLYGNSVTDDGLASLQPLTKLREINLSLLPITDTGLKHLRGLSGIENLELLYSEGFAGPKLTNDMVDALKPLHNLNSLNLTGAKIADIGLKRLHSLTKLKKLRLVRTRVSDEGLRAFQAAVPGCEVIQ